MFVELQELLCSEAIRRHHRDQNILGLRKHEMRSNPCIIRVQLFTGMNADIPDKKNRTGKEEPG